MRDQHSRKSMIILSVEIVLMRRGGPQYQHVLAKLENRYDCKIFDCFDHPEYLREVLIEVYGKEECKDIVANIGLELSEVRDEKEVTGFLKALE